MLRFLSMLGPFGAAVPLYFPVWMGRFQRFSAPRCHRVWSAFKPFQPPAGVFRCFGALGLGLVACHFVL